MSAGDNSQHPSLAKLEGWVAGTLEAPAAAQLESHFEACADCRQLAEDLRGYGQSTGDDEAAVWSQEDMERSLGKLRFRILAEDIAASEAPAVFFEPAPEPVPSPEVAPPLRFPAAAPALRRSYAPLAVAASLLAAVLLFVVAERQRQIGRLEESLAAANRQTEQLAAAASQPLANTSIIEAAPLDAPQRGFLSGGPDAGGVMVLVGFDDEALPEGDWRIVIKDATGKEEHVVDGLRPIAGKLHLLLPPGSLPPGEHRLHLFRDGTPWPRVLTIDLGDE